MHSEYQTIKQVIDTPESHDFMATADDALNAFVSEGWTVDNIFYRQWNDGPDFFVERFVTLKRAKKPLTPPATPAFSTRMINSWRYICNIPLDYEFERSAALIGLFDAVDQVARQSLSEREESSAD
jgi:hypothetical protein